MTENFKVTVWQMTCSWFISVLECGHEVDSEGYIESEINHILSEKLNMKM